MNLYQDATEIVDVTADAEIIQDLFSVATTAVYGLSFFLFSVVDVETIHGAVMAVAATTVVSGSSFFSSSAEDVVTIHSVTMVADAMIAAANSRNFKDGSDRPFCMLSHF